MVQVEQHFGMDLLGQVLGPVGPQNAKIAVFGVGGVRTAVRFQALTIVVAL